MDKKTDAMEKKYIEMFLDRMTAERNASSHTVRAYAADLRQFFQFLRGIRIWGEDSENKDFSAIDQGLVRLFMGSLHKRGLSPVTMERKLSTLRAFFRFLNQVDVIRQNPAKSVSSPSKPKTTPDFLTPDEVTALVESPNGSDAKSLRDKAILELFYATGARVSELASLSVEDIDFDRKVITIHGKGGKDRVTPFGSRAEKALRAHLAIQGGEGSDKLGVPVFTNRSAKRLSVRSIYSVVRDRAGKVGIDRPVAPHKLRHTFATHMLDGGANLRDIQEMMGHSSLSTTQKYTHVGLRRLMRVYDAAHPRASLKNEKSDNISEG